MPQTIRIGKIKLGGGLPLVLIAGPCVIESKETALNLAASIRKITAKVNIPFIFKASYDKANRTSIDSFRGPGITKGLEILKQVKKEKKILTISIDP